jgi:hypothetical protein
MIGDMHVTFAAGCALYSRTVSANRVPYVAKSTKVPALRFASAGMTVNKAQLP